MTYKTLLSLALLFTHIGVASAGLPEARDAVKRQDFDFAIGELRPLAIQGSPEAQVLLAHVLFVRRENPQSIAEAIGLVRKAAESGHQTAMLILANMYSKGENVQKDEQESVKWLRRLAELNNPIGLVLLATKYDEGQGVPQSPFISHALMTVAGYALESKAREIKDISGLHDKFGSITHALISKLVEEMRKPENFLKALDAANVDAVIFNKKYADLPSAIKSGVLDAEAGDNKIIVKLGSLYLYGEAQVPRDPKRAAYWFQKAAATGDRSAKDYMARLYLEGVGVDKNYSAAFKLFSELAEEENPGAAAELGVMYKDGLGVPQDFNKALYWLRKSVGGVGEYLYPLAQMYSQGLGVEKNLVLALALAKNSASLLSQSYRLGRAAEENPATLLAQQLRLQLSPHDVAVSSNLAGKLLSAGLEGNQLAAIDLAAENNGKDYKMSPIEVASHFIYSYEDENFPLALSLLEPLVGAGDPAAQYLMGYMYEEGKGVASDTEKAISYFELAEKQGNIDALTRKAGIYERGKGVPQDSYKAFSTFEKAAQRGGAFAQVKIADMLIDGKGVERNTKKAKFWYEQALANRMHYWHSNARNGLAKVYYSEKKFSDAAQNFKLAAATGNKDAQLSLAKMYFEGKGVPRCLQLAYALATVVRRDEKNQAKASLFSEEVQKHLALAGRAPLESLVITLSNLDSYSESNKKDSAEFLRVMNDFESSAIN